MQFVSTQQRCPAGVRCVQRNTRQCRGQAPFPRQAASKRDRISVFQMYTTAKITSLDDIEDLLQSVKNSSSSTRARRDIFVSMNLNYDKVVKYFEVVKRLNATLLKKPDPPPSSS